MKKSLIKFAALAGIAAAVLVGANVNGSADADTSAAGLWPYSSVVSNPSAGLWPY